MNQRITRNELRGLIQNEIGPLSLWERLWPFGKTQIWLSDKVYRPAIIDHITQSLQSYGPIAKHDPDWNDCDDETFRLLGHLKRLLREAVGFAWSPKHAFLVFHDGKKLWVIEPYGHNIQTYQQALRDSWGRYNLKRRGLIVI